MNVRMAIARNVAYYYSSKQAEALDIIKRLLELTSDGEIKINTIDDLLKLIIRIRPIDYNKDIELYRNSQYQTAVSA
jgi:hypothetical protein